MNFKTTLVLLVLLTGFAGAYLWVNARGTIGSKTVLPTAPEALVTGRDFSRITLQRNGQTLVYAREDAGWWQTEPVRFPVADEAIESVINAGLSLTPREIFSFPFDDPIAEGQPDTFAAFGLDPPQARLVYESDTGQHTLQLGHTNVAGTAYLQKSDDPNVYLVEATLHRAVLDADPNAWRPQKLPTLDAERVSRIELRHGKRDIRLARSADGWSLGTEGDERADAEAALRLAAIAQQTQPRSYVDQDPAALAGYGLAEPRVTLTTADPAGRRQTLRLGKAADLSAQTVYATWSDTEAPSPVVFTLPTATVAALDLEADALRDLRVVTALPGTIRGQSVNRVGQDTVELAHRPDGQGFAFVQPQTGYGPDPELAAGWLTTLTQVSPIGSARAPREAQAPLALIELKLTSDRKEFVRLYADRDGRDDVVLAVRESEAVAALVPSEQLAPLLAPVVQLRDRALPPSDLASLETIRLTRDDGHEFRFGQRTPGRWRLENTEYAEGGSRDGTGGGWESGAFDRLMEWLQAPRVEAWTSMSELPRGPITRLSTGPEKPAYVVNTDQHLGQRTDLPGVFHLPPEISVLLAGEYRLRNVLPAQTKAISRVTLGLAGQDPLAPPVQQAVVQLGEDGVYQDADGQRYGDQQKAAALFRKLSQLRVKRYLPALADGQRQTPIKVFELETDGGKTHRLLRYNQGVWSIDGERYFYLDVETDRALTDKQTVWGQALIVPSNP